VVNFDPDQAGAKAAERAIPMLLEEGVDVRVLSLEGGLDPDEYVRENGADAYRAKLDAAAGYFHWLADRTRTNFDMRSARGRVEAFKSLLPAVQKIPDRLERAAVADDLASYLGLERSLILDQLKRGAADRRPESRAPAAVAIPAIERILLSALLASDQARREVLPLLTPEMLSDFQTGEVFEALRHSGALDGPAAFAATEARLGEGAQKLLHQATAADEVSDEASGLEQARACLRRLEQAQRKKQLDGLRARIKAAEREGRVREALEWMTELHRLETARRTRNAGGKE